jgi:hypothetical protein
MRIRVADVACGAGLLLWSDHELASARALEVRGFVTVTITEREEATAMLTELGRVEVAKYESAET